ncbi:MAG: hypothetical protein SFV51_21660 [Bryobacteraceae bacterium]|nr:hypothetical protein [Bryobacteraceae bacterium]
MLEPIVSFFEKLIENFTWKRLAFTVLLLAAIMGVVMAYEWYTGHLALNRVEKQIVLLERLIALDRQNDLASRNRVLRDTFDSLSTELNDFVVNRPISLGSARSLNIPSWVQRVFYSALPWLALGLIMIVGARTMNASGLDRHGYRRDTG